VRKVAAPRRRPDGNATMPVVQRRNDNRVALRLHRGRRIFVVIPRLRDSHVPEWRERFFGAAGGGLAKPRVILPEIVTPGMEALSKCRVLK
jgi:hypothetical protein